MKKNVERADAQSSQPRLAARKSSNGASRAACLALAVGSLLGCYGDQEEGPKVLTPEEQAEYDQQVNLAHEMLNGGRASESLSVLERTEQLNPDGFAVHNNYCVAYGMLQQREKAMAACERAIEIDPENQLARNNLAWVSGIGQQ